VAGGRAGGGSFLIDTSAVHRIMLPAPLTLWREALSAGRVGMCTLTESEVLYSARSPAQGREMREVFADTYAWHVIPDTVWRSMIDMQQTLMDAGCGRCASPVDLIVAATAAHHGLTILHYDRDFETMAKHLGLKATWLIEPGTIA
jgi:predicted nucleic acid-binding protein